MHSASVPGILALDVCSFNDNKILTGGNDKNATVFNKDTQQVVSVLKGHSKKVTKVIYHPEQREEWETVITASPDTTIRIWNVPTLVLYIFKGFVWVFILVINFTDLKRNSY